jgi:hypothetical protein
MYRCRLIGNLAAFVLALCTITGCSEKSATLKGTVTFHNKPVPGGELIFADEQFQKVRRVQIGPDGTYTVTDLPPGVKLQVGIEPAAKSVAERMPKGAKKPPNIPSDSPAADIYGRGKSQYVDIPERFRDPKTSGFTVETDSGSKTFDIPILP